MIALILVLAIIAELIPPFRQLTDYFNQTPQPYKAIAIGISVTGWVLMAGVIAYMIRTQGKPVTDDEAPSLMENGESYSATYPRRNDVGKGREFHKEVTFRQVKEAWQSGQWNQPEWLPIFLGLVALIFITVGMFGFFFIIGSPLVKLVCSGALAYAAIRTAWAFWHA